MKNTPVITLSQKMHHKQPRLIVGFSYDEALLQIMRKIPNARWSATMRSWHLPFNKNSVDQVHSAFRQHARIDSSRLANKPVLPKVARPKKQKRHLSQMQRDTLNGFVTYLRGKRYSKSTVETYSSLVADFLEFMQDKPLETLTNRDVERFAEGHLAPRNYAISTQRQFISAMKLFVRFRPMTQIKDLELERPKRSKKLPVVLSPEEVIDLLRCTTNLKHRAILGLIYSAGLRISELIDLELKHINIDRRQVLIRNSKGRKDRYVVLSESFLPLLSNYIMSYEPTRYFVEGFNGKKYSASSIRKFLQRSCRAAKITKHVTPHTLRHSYATHLLEQGVGLRHIQELLGHAKPETTMIYTHVAKKDLLDIKSPLDTILVSLTKNQKQEQNVLLSGNNRR
ncbi:MAG: site-specific integrase [Flavobacteriaceae bacterium]|nr:site-specific integrase [Flavobacteriaceae bacterium]